MSEIHNQSDVQSKNIGQGTSIWQFCVVLPKAVIGENCNICSHCYIENNVIIGNNVTIKNGVYIWDGVIIEDNVFIGPNVTFTNDPMPRSQLYPPALIGAHAKKNSSIGANSTILPGVILGVSSMVGAGSVVTKDVPDYALVVGNPAKLVRYLSND